MTDEEAARLDALDDRLSQTGEALVAIGAVIAGALAKNGDSQVVREIRARTDDLAASYAENGRPETARLLAGLNQGVQEPWSFFAWLDKKFS